METRFVYSFILCLELTGQTFFFVLTLIIAMFELQTFDYDEDVLSCFIL